MTRVKNLKSKAKKGFFFPLTFSDLIREIKTLKINDSNGNCLPAHMKNKDCEYELGHLVLHLIPNQDITMFSLPDHFDHSSYKELVIQSIKALVAKVDLTQDSSSNFSYSSYAAYIDKGEIKLTRQDVQYQRGKYRGDSKFSNAFKAKITSVNEVLLN